MRALEAARKAKAGPMDVSASRNAPQPQLPRMGPLRSSNTRGSHHQAAVAVVKPSSVQSSWSRQTLASEEAHLQAWKDENNQGMIVDQRGYGSGVSYTRDLHNRPLSEQLKVKVQFQNLLLHPDAQGPVAKPHIRSLRDHFSENLLKKEALSNTDRKKPFRDGLFDLKKQFASSKTEKTPQLRIREGGPGGFSRSQPKHTRTYQALSEDRNVPSRQSNVERGKNGTTAFSALKGPGSLSKRGTASEDYGSSFLLDSNHFFSINKPGAIINIPTRGNLIGSKPNFDGIKQRDGLNKATLVQSHLLSKNSLDQDEEMSERYYDFDESHKYETTGSVAFSKVSTDSQKQLPNTTSKQRLAPVSLEFVEPVNLQPTRVDNNKSALTYSLRKADKLVFNQDPVDKIFHVADKKKYYGGNQFYKRMGQTKSVDGGEHSSQSESLSASPGRPQLEMASKPPARDTVLKESSFIWKRVGQSTAEPSVSVPGSLLSGPVLVPRLEIVPHVDCSTDAFSMSIASTTRPRQHQSKGIEPQSPSGILPVSDLRSSQGPMEPSIGLKLAGRTPHGSEMASERIEGSGAHLEDTGLLLGSNNCQPFSTLEQELASESPKADQSSINPSFRMDNTGFTWAASRSNRHLS